MNINSLYNRKIYIKYLQKFIIKGILSYILMSCIILANIHQYPDGWNELQNDDGWKLIKELERVKIYSKQISVSPILAYKAELISNINSQLILDAAWDVENSVKIFPNAYIKDAGIYKKYNKNSYTAYQLFDIPFISKRLYQFNSIKLKNSVHWSQAGKLEKKYNPQNIFIPSLNFGSWEVKAYADKTKLIYRVFTDPGGKIPKWLIKMANQKVLPQIVIDLETYVIKNRSKSKIDN